MRDNEYLSIIEGFKSIFEALNIPDFAENISKFIQGKMTGEEFDYYLEEWLHEFNMLEFFTVMGIRGKTRLIPLLGHWIDVDFIFGLTTDIFINTCEETEYRIILNPTNNDKTKIPLVNYVLLATTSEEERDRQLKILKDKLAFLGIKLL